MIILYTRYAETDNYFPDPLDKYWTTTVEQTSLWNNMTYISYVTWDINDIPSEFNPVEITEQEAVDWCNTNIEHKEWEEFTIVDGKIQDNRVLDDIL